MVSEQFWIIGASDAREKTLLSQNIQSMHLDMGERSRVENSKLLHLLLFMSCVKTGIVQLKVIHYYTEWAWANKAAPFKIILCLEIWSAQSSYIDKTVETMCFNQRTAKSTGAGQCIYVSIHGYYYYFMRWSRDLKIRKTSQKRKSEYDPSPRI